MRTILVCALFTSLAACGDDGGGGGGTTDANNNNGVDAKIFLDAPPAMITVSGQATQVTVGGSPAEPGVLIAAYKSTDETTPIAMTTSDSQGNYSLTIMTNGAAIDGYIKATKSGLKDTYLYPPEPLGMDFNMASVKMVTPGTYDAIYTLTQVGQQADTGLIGLIVTDGTNPVAGATVSSAPASTYRYNSTQGLPTTIAMSSSTQADGLAYMLNVPPGQVTVSATKTGSTFKSHGLKAWANQLTTTLIIQ